MAEKTPAAQSDLGLRLPRNREEWDIAVQKQQAYGTIHSFTAAQSASKIELPQYLLLRTLWSYAEVGSTRSSARPPALSTYLCPDNIQVAQDLLSGSSDWANYLKSIRENISFPQGSMGIVRYYQHLCTEVKTTPDYGSIDKVHNSPMKLRPRKPVNYAAISTDSAPGSPAHPPAGGGVGDAPGPEAQPPAGVGVGDAPGPEAQPPAGVGVGDAPGPELQDIIAGWIDDIFAPGASLPVSPSTPENLTAAMNSIAIGGAQQRQRTESNYSSTPDSDAEWDSPKKNCAVEDEQIVNTALIILLNVLTLTFKKAQGKWSLYRQPFCVRDRNGEKVYEARVDGKYTVGVDIVSIVEVKPYDRLASTAVNTAVSMQETAQMAAWISQFPPADAMTAPPERMYRRLLLSQDKDKVFCTVASFRPAYVRYICDWIDTTQEDEDVKVDEGFLKMDQQGPFMVARDKHMELLGKLLLAYMIQGSLEE